MTILTACQMLEENLRHDILSGKLPGNRRIPSESVLAKRYSICRSTVRKALNNLAADGLLRRARGSGTFVSAPAERNIPRSGGTNLRRRRKNVIFLSFSSSYSEALFRMNLNRFPLFDEMSKVLEPNNLNLMFVHVGVDGKAPQCLLDREADGILFNGIVSQEFWSRYMADFPCVAINQFNPELNCSCVRSDPNLRAWLALSHLKELGHVRIGYIANEIEEYQQRERYNAFLNMKQYLGIEHRPGWDAVWQRQRVNGELNNELEIPDYVPYLKSVMSQSEAPTAFVCMDDWRAKCAETALNKLGFSVPENISLVGGIMMPDLPPGLNYAYTSIVENSDRIYSQAACLLADQIKSDCSDLPVTLLIPPDFKIGKSTRKLLVS